MGQVNGAVARASTHFTNSNYGLSPKKTGSASAGLLCHVRMVSAGGGSTDGRVHGAMIKKLAMAVWVVWFFGTGATAQAAGFELPGSRSHMFTSTILKDEFHIVVSLPFGYDRSDKRYPLLLALDGDGMFGMESDIPRLLSFEGRVPPMIVASIVYGDLQTWFQKRKRDFHPANDGARTFLAALGDEIVPFLEATYRVDPASRTLYGHSSAGLFAFYAGIQSPSLFSGIIATSPSLEEEPAWAATFDHMIDQNRTALPKMYVSVDGSETAMLAAVAPKVAALSAALPAGQVKFETLAEGSHMAVIPKAFTAGLHFIFVK